MILWDIPRDSQRFLEKPMKGKEEWRRKKNQLNAVHSFRGVVDEKKQRSRAPKSSKSSFGAFPLKSSFGGLRGFNTFVYLCLELSEASKSSRGTFLRLKICIQTMPQLQTLYLQVFRASKRLQLYTCIFNICIMLLFFITYELTLTTSSDYGLISRNKLS